MLRGPDKSWILGRPTEGNTVNTARSARHGLALVCIIVLAAFGVAACGKDSGSGGGSGGGGGGDITVALTSFPDYVDPQLSYTVEGWEVLWNVYTPLLTYKHVKGEEGTKVVPGLAEAMPEISEDGKTYNVNADTFAGAIAGAMGAKRFLLLTDVPGVLDKDKNLIPELTVDDCRRLIADGTITGGMIPKIETCIYALEQGVEAVVIVRSRTAAR